MLPGGAELTHPAFNKGIDFIRRHIDNKSNKPFFCFISTIEPHDPYISPQQFFDMYNPETIEVNPTVFDDPSGKPDIVKRMRSVWTRMTYDQWRQMTAAYYAVISYLDHQVGRVIQTLKKMNCYENTIIIFTSDHGDMLGGHGLVTKGGGTPYEEVYNVPLILRTPGMKAAREDSQTLTSLVDLAPTLLDLCDLKPLPGVHGRSLREVLEQRADADEWQDAYGEFFGQRFVYTQRIVWHGSWKYVFSPGGIDELYNLTNDPRERTNLVNDPDHYEILIKMTKRMWKKMKEIGDESLFNAHYAAIRTAPIGQQAVLDFEKP